MDSLKSKQFAIILLSFLLINTTIAEEDNDEDSGETGGVNVPVDNLTKENCLSRRPECCKELYLGDVSSLKKCVRKDSVPDENEKDPRKLAKFLSCAVECKYRTKNYIGTDDKLNMTMIRKDAEEMYGAHPRERDYYVSMYEYCVKEGTKSYGGMKRNPAARVLLAESCNPALLLIYMCTTSYHKHYECPYFKWEGKSDTPAQASCAAAQKKCYQFDQ